MKSPIGVVLQEVLIALLAFSFNAWAGLRIGHLRCEYLKNPLGIDALQPRLSWILETGERGQRQTAYQILVASGLSELKKDRGDLWDSGKVLSDRTTFIRYEGRPLTSREACFWKVRIWGKDGRPSPWSQTGYWEMGLLNAGAWQGAQWIARTTNMDEQPAPMFRRQFALEGKIKRARVYLCGLGYYELFIDGRRVGNHLRDPDFTRFDRRDLYVTYDVTPFLKCGANVVGVILGNGWFNMQSKTVWKWGRVSWRASPRLLLSLFVEYADGHTAVICSDSSWKTATGPIRFDSDYGGEIHDARLEKPGWDKIGYEDSTWQPAEVVAAPGGKLAAQMMPPITVAKVIKPVKLSQPRPGVFVFDMGQNFAGYTQLIVKGKAGTEITLRHGERLFPNGTLDNRAIDKFVKRMGKNQQFQRDNYILKGGDVQTWHPVFTYYGFQYVQVTGFPGNPTLNSVDGVFTHSAVPVAGEFECSNPLLNKIQHATRWSYLSNLQGIPTDCPTREKNGWTGDAQLATQTGIYNFMPAAVYSEWLNAFDDEQLPSGELPNKVPTSGSGYHCNPAWDSAYELIAYYLYEYYGDTQPLCEHYDGLKRHVDFLTTQATDGIISGGLGDWAPFKTRTPANITNTAYYYRDARIVSLAASLTGKTDESAHYAQLADQIRTDFNTQFYHPSTGTYGNGSQTSLSCALYFDLVEPGNRTRVVQNLVASVKRSHDHLDGGILGAQYVLSSLTDNGCANLAYQIASQTTLPSWGWWIEQGATTLWESWNGSGSHNHIMFGTIGAWFYQALAGINADPAAPGFKHFIIQPHPVGDLMFARADYNSIHGKIVSAWRIKRGRFHLHVVVPPNTTATVYIPDSRLNTVREDACMATNANGVISSVQQGTPAVFEVESGRYNFAAPLRTGSDQF